MSNVKFIVCSDQFCEVCWVDANYAVALNENSLQVTDYKINMFYNNFNFFGNTAGS